VLIYEKTTEQEVDVEEKKVNTCVSFKWENMLDSVNKPQ